MTLTLFHTSHANQATFAALLAEMAPDVPVRHVVDEDLLRAAREEGRMTAAMTQRVSEQLAAAIGDDTDVLLCTCSTIGGAVEDEGRHARVPVLRVDRPMAVRAVALGTRLAILATLRSTLGPTRALLEDAARRADRDVALSDIFVDGAWAHFERGDTSAYATTIAEHIDTAADTHDVIVLAQASMTPAVALRPNLRVPVLSSPRIGLQAAVAAYRQRHAG
jgi:Asp/Glu/Hydantoin racemase